MHKYLKISLWIASIILIVVVLVLVSRKQDNMLCESINVKFINGMYDEQYLDESYVNHLINSDTILGRELRNTNISKLESLLNNNSYIEKAEVYKKIDGTIAIDIIQRMPIVRIINKNNLGYYIDKDGILMPVSKRLNKRILVANGEITYSPNLDTLVNIYSKQFDKDSSINCLRDIHKITQFITKDKFWNAQIQQIYISENQEIELVPLVGSHILQLGTIDMYEEKFKKLYTMYDIGFNSVGWNKYKTVNLKYKGQVVCGKSS